MEETLLHINLDNVLIIGDLNARTGDSSDYTWDTAALDNVLDDAGTTELMKRGKIRKMLKFNFNEETVDVVWDYKYL